MLPHINAPNSNPLVTGVNQGLVQPTIAGWSRPQLWQWQDTVRSMDSMGMVDQFPVPSKPPLPRAVIPGGRRINNAMAVNTIAVQQQPYEATLSISHDLYTAAKGLQGVFDAIVAGFADCSSRAIPAELSRHLAVNNVLSNYDNLTFFNASHPINPNNPSQKARASNSTTYSNSLGLGSFTSTNLIAAIQTISKTAVYEDGEPIGPRSFKLFVTPGNMFKAMQWTRSPLVNFGSGAPIADVATNTNPFSVIAGALGVTIDVIVMAQYPTNDTDWYISIGDDVGMSPFIMSIAEWYSMAQQTDPSTYARFRSGEREFQVTAQLGIAKSLPNCLFKCS